MKKKATITLTTERVQQAMLAEARPPRIIRIYPVSSYGGGTLYYMNSLPFPVPAVLRHLDGWTVGATVRLTLVALAAAVAAGWWALRLLGRAR